MDDIFNQIMELETDNLIWYFIINRTFILELRSEEKTVGQGYTDSFRDYISNKYILNHLLDLKTANVRI